MQKEIPVFYVDQENQVYPSFIEGYKELVELNLEDITEKLEHVESYSITFYSEEIDMYIEVKKIGTLLLEEGLGAEDYRESFKGEGLIILTAVEEVYQGMPEDVYIDNIFRVSRDTKNNTLTLKSTNGPKECILEIKYDVYFVDELNKMKGHMDISFNGEHFCGREIIGYFPTEGREEE